MKIGAAAWTSLAIALGSGGCDGPSGDADAGARTDAVISLDAGGGVDAGEIADRDGGGSDATALPAPTAEERAACANLAALEEDGCALVGTDCHAALVGIRVDHGEPDCLSEYDAWVACLTTVSTCDTGGAGVLCPTEYSALGMCSR